MFYEVPLVAFTVLAQAAVGAHLTVNGVGAFRPLISHSRLNMARFVILVMMGVGFLCSTAHLGSPLRALNSLNRVGSSALSNEILAGIGFLASAGIAWLMSVMDFGSGALRRGVHWLSMLVGIVFMFAMANVYSSMNTVPAWHSTFTGLEFGFTVVTLGVVLGYLLMNVLGICEETSNRILTWLGISLLAVHLMSIILQILYFSSLSTAVYSGLARVHSLSDFVVAQIILLVLTMVIWLYMQIFMQSTRAKNRLIGVMFALLLVAEFCGRNVFYGMHFTAGLS
jgi:anaerobic dimethyl sulfoxide reductase subunit C (anchor subunit)